MMIAACAGARSLHAQPPPGGATQHELREREEVLRAQIAHIQTSLARLEPRIAKARSELEQLTRQVSAWDTNPEKPARSPEEAGTMKVEFRLPLAEASAKHTKYGLACRGHRIITFKFSPIAIAIAKDVDYQLARTEVFKGTGRRTGKIAVAGGPVSHVNYALERKGDLVRRELRLVFRTDAAGEDVAAINRPHSRFQQALADCDPAEIVLLFAVYGDSHDVFRAARALAWKRGFEIGWAPIDQDALVPIGAGAVTTVNR
jgi:hypothetical protein